MKMADCASGTSRGFNGAEVVVPNGDLISKEVINWTLSDQIRRVDIPVRVAYGTDPRRVQEILKKMTEENPVILKDPAPAVLLMRFGESSLDFELRFWTRVGDSFEASSEMHVNTNVELQRAGIQVAVPRRELHMKTSET